MADTYLNIKGKLLKLIDNGDGTLSMAASTERSVLPSGAATSAKQDAIIDYVDELESKIGEVAELPTTNTIMDRLKAIATNTANIKVDADTINVNTDELESLLTTLSAKDFATQATLAEILAKIIAAPATEAKQTALNALIGEVQAAPTANTMLARLKSLEDKIAAIIAGTSPAVTTLSGSEMELYSDTISDRPSANSVAKGTTFTLINANFDTWISDGVEWKEV